MEALLGPILTAINAAGVLAALVMLGLYLEGRGRTARAEGRADNLQGKLDKLQVETLQANHETADALREINNTWTEIFNDLKVVPAVGRRK